MKAALTDDAPWTLEQDLDAILAATETLWPSLREGHVFVTGGTGFIGCWLLETLRRAHACGVANMQATILTRSIDTFMQQQPQFSRVPIFHFVQGDVSQFEFPLTPFTHVVHAATEPSNRYHDKPDELFDTVIGGTRRVLELARKSGSPRVLYLSSGAVYGVQPPTLERIPESWRYAPDCTDPAAAYAEAKRCAEMLCAVQAAHYHLPVIIARVFTLIGPFMPLQEQFAAGNFLHDALAGKPVNVTGDGTAVRSYLYAADLVIWLLHLLVRGLPGRAYNVGSEQAVSIGELAKVTAETAGNGMYKVHGVPTPGVLPMRYVPDTQLAREAFGLHQSVNLEQAIHRCACWWRKR